MRNDERERGNLAFSDYLKAIGAVHVVLDPFPTSLYEPSFLALSLGTPVITMPSTIMSGRLTLSLLTRPKREREREREREMKFDHIK